MVTSRIWFTPEQRPNCGSAGSNVIAFRRFHALERRNKTGVQRLGGPTGWRMPPAILPSASSVADIMTPPLANTKL